MDLLAVTQVGICDMPLSPISKMQGPVELAMFFCKHMTLIITLNINWGFTCTHFHAYIQNQLNPWVDRVYIYYGT